MTYRLPFPRKLPKWAYAIPLVVLLSATWTLVIRLNVVANWPEVEGEVIRIVERADSETESGRAVYHDYPVFRYTDPDNEAFENTASAIDSIGGLAIGDKLMIRIDPNDKDHCYKVGWWATFGTPVIMFGFTPIVLGVVIGAKFGFPKLHELNDAGYFDQVEKGAGESG